MIVLATCKVALRGVREMDPPKAPTDPIAAAAAADDVGCPDEGGGVHPPKPEKLGAGSNGVEEYPSGPPS
jgi:hypothetical protein